MPFRNYSLTKNGQLTIGQIFSPDFQTGVSGWEIRKDGSAEFNNAVFRGTVVATGFAATIVVAGGPYAGTYTIETGEFTDADGNQLAAVQWLNGTHPAAIAPYIAAVSGPGAGAFASLHSGKEDSGDFEAVIWVQSHEASSTGASLVLFDATNFQPFGGSGPTLFLGADGGVAVDSWHSIPLDAGWTSVVTPQYRKLPDGNVQVRGQASRAGTTGAVSINNSTPLAAAYTPAANRVYRPPVAGDNAGTVQMGSNGVFAMRASGFSATQAIMDGIYSL